jgi:hypothetical protein
VTEAAIAPSGADLRCSTYSRVHTIDPVGTAGSYAGYLLVEWPLPWPADIGEIPELSPLAALASERRLRLQGLVARNEGSSTRTVICYSSPPGPFRAFARHELVVSPAEVVEAARALVEGVGGDGLHAAEGVGGRDDRRADGRAGGRLEGERSAPATTAESGQHPSTAVRDVLLCSHGRRDRCCGSLGTALAEQLAADPPAPSGASPTRLWRTSHTGGHRFAPTAIVLPEGTVWGYLDAARLSSVLVRREPVLDLLGSYRGCSGLPSRELQALERAVIAEIGWQALDARRSGRVGAAEARRDRLDASQHGAPVHAAPALETWPDAVLELEWDDGRQASYAAEVGVARSVPIPDCGSPVECSFKVERELGLRGLRRLR